MAFRDVKIFGGGLKLWVLFGTTHKDKLLEEEVIVESVSNGRLTVKIDAANPDDDMHAVLLSGVLRGLCGADEPRFISPIQPLSSEQLDCTQHGQSSDVDDLLLPLAKPGESTARDVLMRLIDKANRDPDEDFCNELAEFIPCGDGEDLVTGARKLRDELVRVKTELAAAKDSSSGIRVENRTAAPLAVSASIGSDGSAQVVVSDSPFGTKPTEPQVEPPRRGRRPAKPKEDPAVTNAVTVPKPAVAPAPDVSAHQAAAPPVEPVVVSADPKPMGLTDQLIHLLSEPPMPIGVDPLDDRDQQGNYCDSALMRLYYRQDVCRSQAIARQAAGYDHKTWRPQKPPEMLVELTDKGAETLADVFFQLNEISGGSIQQLNLWVTLQGSRAAAADAIKAKYAQIRARAKRS